jgi:hypothetical protein
MVAIFQELPGIDRPGAIAAHAMYVPIVFSRGWETPAGAMINLKSQTWRGTPFLVEGG